MKDAKRKKKNPALEWLAAIGLACLAAIILHFLCWPAVVEGTSMRDTLENGDMVVFSRLLLLSEVRRGDVVVFVKKDLESGGIVKRIAGVPGDVVETAVGSLTLGEGEYFVLGDNREESYDSRYFGQVNRDELVGRVFFRIFPLDKLGRIR